jgi:hypothetical protein
MHTHTLFLLSCEVSLQNTEALLSPILPDHMCDKIANCQLKGSLRRSSTVYVSFRALMPFSVLQNCAFKGCFSSHIKTQRKFKNKSKNALLKKCFGV